MSAHSPVATDSHAQDASAGAGTDGGGGGAHPVTHRTKHRKEVKRYHQRQLNKQLREEAKARDAQLFLFERGSNAGGTKAGNDGAAGEGGPLQIEGGGSAAASHAGKKASRKASATPTPSEGDARLTDRTASPQPPSSTQLSTPLVGLSKAASSWDFDFVLRKPNTDNATAATATAPAGAPALSFRGKTANTARVESSTSTTATATAENSTRGVVSALAQRARAATTTATLPSSSTSVITAYRHLARDTPLTSTPPPHGPFPFSARVGGSASAADVTNENNGNSNGSNGGSAPQANSKPVSVLSIGTGVTSSIAKLLNNAHVQRVEGMAAIPMESPLPTGTDLNRPPMSYLTLDPFYNIHQHAPGFLRNQRIALQHMLAIALMHWQDMRQHALIVTSAEAMRTIFEQIYVPQRPLALRVRRIGPTIIIDSRVTQPSQVQEMRQQALFSKALYLMKETQGRSAVVNDASGATAEKAAATTSERTLALPERRLSSLGASDPRHTGANLHRYSQLLRLRIDTTEVLVGNDAPVVMDRRTNTEHLVRIVSADQVENAASDREQRATLRCWFDAMMANVSHVGTYVERDGTILSYQVKKTNDLLGYMEGRMAAAALSFTSTTLQWIVQHCRRDGATYAVVRDITSNLLKLYELPEFDDSSIFVAETEQFFPFSSASAAPDGGATEESESTSSRSTAREDGPGMRAAAAGSSHGRQSHGNTGKATYAANMAPHLNRFNLNFAKTCFNIGQHLYRDGGVASAGDALNLLLRSLRIFLPCCPVEGVARDMVAEVVQMLPTLLTRRMQADANTTAAAAAAAAAEGTGCGDCYIGGATSPSGFVTAACSSPDLYREALLLCGKFEIPIRRCFEEATQRGEAKDALLQAFYARCLITSSAAVCTVVTASLEAYYCGCHHLRAIRRARSETKARESSKLNSGGSNFNTSLSTVSATTTAATVNAAAAAVPGTPCTPGAGNATAASLRGIDQREGVVIALAAMLPDLLQVVVEGLVRLEETSALVAPLHAVEAARAANSTLNNSRGNNSTANTTATATAGSPNAISAFQSNSNTNQHLNHHRSTPMSASAKWSVQSIPTIATASVAAKQTMEDAASASQSAFSVVDWNGRSPKSAPDQPEPEEESSSTSRGQPAQPPQQPRQDGTVASSPSPSPSPSPFVMPASHPSNSPAGLAVQSSMLVHSNVAATTPTACGTVLDLRTQVDTRPLRYALCELYGDVVLVAMADTASGFTTRALAELGLRLEARAQQGGRSLPTTLTWLTTLKADVVSLSFTALRFYGRVSAQSRRHLVKLAQVYYLVGKEHHRTARYTKALEALHRSKSLLHSSHKTPEDAAFGDTFGTHGMLQWADVMRLLGDVYRSVVERKLETAHGVAATTMAQPLLAGPLHNLPEEADTFFSQALSAYTQGASDDGCKAAKACTLLLYASVSMERVAVTGEPATHATAQRIAQYIKEAEGLVPHLYVPEREWQLLRLFTVTHVSAIDSALARAAEEVLLRATYAPSPTSRAPASTTSCSRALDLRSMQLWVDADVTDAGEPRRERLITLPPCRLTIELQRALGCCVMVERCVLPGRSSSDTGSLAINAGGTSAVASAAAGHRARDAAKQRSIPVSDAKYRNLLRWIGRATAYLTTVIQTFSDGKEVWRTAAERHQWQAALRTWRETTVAGCVHRFICMIALRLLVAAQSQLPSTKQAEARAALRQIAQALEKAPGMNVENERAYDVSAELLEELHALLQPFVAW